MSELRPRILLVDDDEAVLRAYKNVLSLSGCVVETCTNGRLALEQMDLAPFDVVVTDVSMPEMNEQKNGSAPRVSGVRAITSPTASARETDSALPRRLGVQPRSRATERIRSRVSAATPGLPFSAKDTAPFETPATRATSAMVVGEVAINK